MSESSSKRGRDIGRKYESRSAKGKKKSSWENYTMKISDSMDRFVSSCSILSTDNNDILSTDNNVEEGTQPEAAHSSSTSPNFNIVPSYELTPDKSEESELISEKIGLNREGKAPLLNFILGLTISRVATVLVKSDI